MACVIQWTGPTGPTTVQRDSAIEAIKYTTEPMAKGRPDVVIKVLADYGKAYAPADFALIYLEHR